MYKKKAIRKQIKGRKAGFSREQLKQKSEQIITELENLPAFKNSHKILAYWSLPDEVHTHDFILKWASTKKFFLPVIQGDELLIGQFEGLQSLQYGEKYNIPEPKTGKITNSELLDMILVPGVAFDKNNNRLGRGKAYYDKLLKTLDGYKVGVSFDFQFIDEIPVSRHDIKMDTVVVS